jgi:hypothetical protein
MNVASITAMAMIHGLSTLEVAAGDRIAADIRPALDPPASAASWFAMLCSLLGISHVKRVRLQLVWPIQGLRRSNRDDCHENSKARTGPEAVRQIHNNGFGSAANNNPLKGDVAGGINLLMRKPRRDIKEVPCLQSCVAFPSLTPPNIRRTAEGIGNRVLLSMVMDSRAGSRFDQK